MESYIHVNNKSGQGNGTVLVTLDENRTKAERRALIHVRTQTKDVILTIIQKRDSMINYVFTTTDGSTINSISKNDETISFNTFVQDMEQLIDWDSVNIKLVYDTTAYKRVCPLSTLEVYYGEPILTFAPFVEGNKIVIYTIESQERITSYMLS